jgi:cobalt-zinc-cadmium efflux system protein
MIPSKATDACVVRPPVPVTRKLWIVLLLTGGFMLVEVVGGILSGSLALLADAGHMLTDVGAIALSLLTARMAQRPADHSNTYGYMRWEILAALVNGAALIGIAGWVVIEAIGRMGSPPPIKAGLFVVVASLGLVVNLIGLSLLHGSHHGSLNTRGVYLHIMGDVLGSVAALAAALVVGLTGWTLADPIISIALSLLILVGAWRLVRESTDILLEAVPSHVSMPEVQRCMLAVEGVDTIHDLHVWAVTSGVVAMSGHVVVPRLEQHPGVLERIRKEMSRLGIGHVTIQLETSHGCLEIPSGREEHAGHRH